MTDKTCGNCANYSDYGWRHKRRYRAWGRCREDYKDDDGQPIRLPFTVKRKPEEGCTMPEKFRRRA